jgi:hypothetical protein
MLPTVPPYESELAIANICSVQFDPKWIFSSFNHYKFSNFTGFCIHQATQRDPDYKTRAPNICSQADCFAILSLLDTNNPYCLNLTCHKRL